MTKFFFYLVTRPHISCCRNDTDDKVEITLLESELPENKSLNAIILQCHNYTEGAIVFVCAIVKK